MGKLEWILDEWEEGRGRRVVKMTRENSQRPIGTGNALGCCLYHRICNGLMHSLLGGTREG